MTVSEPHTSRLLTAFEVDDVGVAAGFVVDPGDLQARFAVEILADGLPLALLRSDHHRADLEVGDGCYGFRVVLTPSVLAHAERVDARLANTLEVIGSVLEPWQRRSPAYRGGVPGHVHWDGPLRLSGWVDVAPLAPAPTVKALVNEVEVARTVCRAFAQPDEGPTVVRAFHLDLPRDFADGRVRDVCVMLEDGTELAGSPCPVFALADGFAGLIDTFAELESERARARFADGILPQVVPFSDFKAWQARFPVAAPPPTRTRTLVLIVGEDGLDATLESLEEQTGVDWTAVVFPSCGSPVAFDPRLLRDLVADASLSRDLVVAAMSGTVFHSDALALFVAASCTFPHSEAFYSDGTAAFDGEIWPMAFPAYDDELFLEQGYCALCFALRPGAMVRAATAGCGSLFSLFPDPISPDRRPGGLPVHLPAPLAHFPSFESDLLTPCLREATTKRLEGRGIPAEITPTADASGAAVRVRRLVKRPAVSILIAQRGRPGDLRRTLDNLKAWHGFAHLQIIVAHQNPGSGDEEAVLATARALGCELVPNGDLCSEAHLLNRAAAQAGGDLLLTLRSGLASTGSDWLEDLTSRCVTSDVGAVGALVVRPNGLVREAGFVLGPRFSVAHRFRERHINDGGYLDLLRAAQELSAVSAACMMTRRSWFLALAGFDESGVSPIYHDVDYCLRLRAAGLRVVFTPHARLIDGAGEPVPRDETLLAGAQKHELRRLRTQWRLAPGCDPFYSPWMAMDGTPYSGLAWPPIPYKPRQPILPRARQLPSRLS